MSNGIKLRDYQEALATDIDSAYARGVKNVLAVMPTGAGKTVLFSHLMQKWSGPRIAIAHRQELVAQISMTFCRFGIAHSIVAPIAVIRTIVDLHRRELGRTTYSPLAEVIVAGVDTLIRRGKNTQDLEKIKYWVQDEAHHTLRANKWGKAAALMPNAHGLGVTATPIRADRKGLGIHADGVYNEMLLGPQMRHLIDGGFLTDYKIYAPETFIDMSSVKFAADGDFSRPSLVKAVRKSQIVGDVVSQYLKIAPGKSGITFATDVKTARDIAESFKTAGVSAVALSGEDNDLDRANAIKAFRAGEIKQLVNVDLFGEGFDVPMVEVVSDARPTASFSAYSQRFGRMLRLADGKKYGLYIDHVGNVVRHRGPPDFKTDWSLNRLDTREREKTEASSLPPTKKCNHCTAVYFGYSKTCPECGKERTIIGRSVEEVEGDLTEMTPEMLNSLKEEVAEKYLTPEEMKAKYRGLGDIILKGHINRQAAFREAQKLLVETMATWSGVQHALGRTEVEQRMVFFHRKFGIDTLSARGLTTKATENLILKINEDLKTHE